MSTLSEELAKVKLDIDSLHALVCIETGAPFPKMDRRGTKLWRMMLNNYEKLELLTLTGTNRGEVKHYALTETGRAWLAAILATEIPRRMYVTPAGKVVQPELDTEKEQ